MRWRIFSIGLAVAAGVFGGGGTAVAVTQDGGGPAVVLSAPELDVSVSSVGVSLAHIRVQGGTGTIYYRYRAVAAQDDWVAGDGPASAPASLIILSGLRAATPYIVQAGLTPWGPYQATVFTTKLPAPTVSGVAFSAVGAGGDKTEVVGTAAVEYGGGQLRTLYYRYSVDDWRSWKGGGVNSGAPSVSFLLSCLTPNTRYRVQVSLSPDFLPSQTAEVSLLVGRGRLT